MLTVVAAILVRDGRILVCQRRGDAAHPLKWEFPGGKVEPGEELTAALKRELREELQIEANIGREFARYPFAYPGKVPIELVFFLVTQFRREITNQVFEKIDWSDPANLVDYDFLEGDSALIQLISEVKIDQIE